MEDIWILEPIDKISIVHGDTVYTRISLKNQKSKTCVNALLNNELTHVRQFGNRWSSVVTIDVASCGCTNSVTELVSESYYTTKKIMYYTIYAYMKPLNPSGWQGRFVLIKKLMIKIEIKKYYEILSSSFHMLEPTLVPLSPSTQPSIIYLLSTRQ